MKIDYLRRLLDITKKQRVLLEVDEYEEFIKLLDERQQLIDEIQEMDLKQKKELTDEERTILKEIIKINQSNTNEYNRQITETKQKLKQLNHNINRNDRYSDMYSSYDQGSMFDSKYE